MSVSMNVAVVGGDERVERTQWPHGCEVDCYPSARYAGNGPMTRLKSALAAGRYTLVVLLTRWVGHSESAFVRDQAKCRVVTWPQGYGALAKALKEGRF